MILPPVLAQMLNAWNEMDLTKVRSHLEQALAPDVVFADPNYLVNGIDEFEQMVIEFRNKYPDAECLHSSGYDSHHNRYRYQWQVKVGGAVGIQGYDVTTLNDDGLVARVDGFFGEIPEKA